MSVMSNIEEMDFSILSRKVTMEEIEAYRSRDGKKRIPIKQHVIINIALWILLLIIYVLQSTRIIGSMHLSLNIWMGIIAAFHTTSILSMRFRAIKAMRIGLFAKQQGMIYEASPKQVMAGNGLLFDIGHDRKFKDVLYNIHKGKRAYEIGTYKYSEGSGDSERDYTWRYVCMTLGRNLPHMILDAKGNNIGLFGKKIKRGLPVSFKDKQRVSLEGNFDDHFTLYAPEKYDVDVRYVFTPDIMQLMISESAEFDAEIVDDKLYFYSPGSVRYEVFIEHAIRLISVVGKKIYDQTDYYRDERTKTSHKSNVVSDKGKRLRRKRGVGVIVFVAFVIIYCFLSIIIGVVSMFMDQGS